MKQETLLQPQSSIFRQLKNTEVTFNFTCSTEFGERVGLIGSMPLLGHWDPSKAIYLNTTQSAYPNWSIKVDLPRDKIVEYKYVVIADTVNKNTKPKVKWENLPTGINRIVNTYGKKEAILYESMTSLESIEEYVEVTQGKQFMSSSDIDSIKNEDLE